MGFFSGTPKDRLGQHDVKKELKRLNLTSHQQQDFLSELEAVRKKHGSDHYSQAHIEEAGRKLKDRTGDSLYSSHVERATAHLTGKIQERIRPAVEPVAEKPQPENLREYKGLNPDKLDAPKRESTSEPKSEASEEPEHHLDIKEKQ